jgi:hypothetical protein
VAMNFSSVMLGKIRFAIRLFLERKLSVDSPTALFKSSYVGANGALWLHHSAAEPRSRVAILSRHNAGLVVASPFSQSSRKFCGSSWSRPENSGSWSVSAGVVTRNCSMKAVRASTSFLVRVEAQAIRSCSC